MKTHVLLGLLSASTVFAHSPSSPVHRRIRRSKHLARSLPSGWSSAGCVSDGDNRALNEYIVFTDNMTPSVCASECDSRGFKFAGVESGRECYCGNSLRNGQGVAKPASECNAKCAGSNDICGGPWRLSLFQKGGASQPEPEPTPGPQWKTLHKCAADPADSRLMSFGMELENNTPAKCQNVCANKGYKFAGVEYGKECWCANELNGKPKAAPESECQVPCAGDSKTYCGGSWHMAVYQLGSGTPDPDPQPEPEPEPEPTPDPSDPTAPDGWAYNTCMIDASDRILTAQQPGGGENTPAFCIAACVKGGYTMAAVEAGHECFCGNNFAYSPTLAPESDCNLPCAGDSSVKCGGKNRASVYYKLAPKSGLLSKLLPVRKSLEWWTTSNEVSNPVELSDKSLRATKITSALGRNYGNFDGKQTMMAHYPAGSRNPGHDPKGGISFYAPGPAFLDLTKAKEATFGYSVYFPNGFNAVLGGKIFGLYGGNSDDEATGCSGGSRSTACFSARMMWREELAGEFYTYLPPYDVPGFEANEVQCRYPDSECNPTYGASIGRGHFHFPQGQWYTISERVRLNTAGEADGELELIANGETVIKLGGLILRDSAAGRIRGAMYQTFFGGSQDKFETPTDQDVYFADFTTAITEYL